MPNFCAAPNCTRKSTESDLAFFRFPREPERCKMWVENCRRADLETKTSDQLNKHYRLCAKHFDPAMVYKTSPYRTVLKDTAIPTIFDLTSHLKNPHTMRHRKRIKELTEEDLEKIKERRLVTSTDQLVKKEAIVEESNTDEPQMSIEEKEYRDYLRSLFEIMLLMGKKNIPLNNDPVNESEPKTSNLQCLLDLCMNAGNDVLRKRFQATAVNSDYLSSTHQCQLLDVCENTVREEILMEVRESRFFSLVTGEVLEIAGDEFALVERLETQLTQRWGLSMEDCRGQAHKATGAFGRNLQGETLDVYSAANSLTAVLHSLNEVNDNIDVYHEFWYEEALNVAGLLGVQENLPRLFIRKQRTSEIGEVQAEAYYKEYVTMPVLCGIMQEVEDMFSESNLKALKCLSLVPGIMGHLKFNTMEENCTDVYRSDLPSSDTLTAELHCWRIKWKHRGKEVPLPNTIHETLQLPDVKFFPNVNTFLKVLSTLPVLKLAEKNNAALKRLQDYFGYMPSSQWNKSLAMLNINTHVKCDLEVMVDKYCRLYPEEDPGGESEGATEEEPKV
ncbi:unnamed protein product [Knipowitschia caucasica]